jgi:hypothetical protein
VTRVPEAACWHCATRLDGATAADGEARAPKPGSISLCVYCCAVGVFDEELVVVAPTAELLAELDVDLEFRRMFTAFCWQRQRALLSGLLRPPGD